MKAKVKSIFNLIEFFRDGKRSIVKATSTASHCEQKHHHDFYCETEKPFISIQ